jgi:hypothetical protein
MKFTVTGISFYADGFDEEVEARDACEAREIARARQETRAEEIERRHGLSLNEVDIQSIVMQEPLPGARPSGWTRATLTMLGDDELIGTITSTNPEGRYGQEWEWAMEELRDRLQRARGGVQP